MAETELPNPRELEELKTKRLHSMVAVIAAVYKVMLKEQLSLFSFPALFALAGAFLCANGYLQFLSIPFVH